MKKVLFITTVITVFAVFTSFKSANTEVVYTFKNVSIDINGNNNTIPAF